jgi:hypothetical protein
MTPTVHQDLDEAIRRIDKAFGTGYTKAHPELIAALVQAAAFDRVERVRKDVGDLVRKALTELSELLEALCQDNRIARKRRPRVGWCDG